MTPPCNTRMSGIYRVQPAWCCRITSIRVVIWPSQASRPSASANRSTNAPRASVGVSPQISATWRRRYRTVLAWTNRARAVASSAPPDSRKADTVSSEHLARLGQRPVDAVDQVFAGVDIAEQRPLGQQVVGRDRPGRVGPGRRRPQPGQRRAGHGRRLGRARRPAGRRRPGRRRRPAAGSSASAIGVGRRRRAPRPAARRARRPWRRRACAG